MLKDRSLLLLCGIALLAVSVGGMFVVDSVGLDEHWGMLWLYSVFLALALFAIAREVITRRARKIYRRWPLLAVTALFLVLHVAVVGWLLSGPGREWRMAHFYVLSLVEVIVFGLAFGQAYTWSTTREWRANRSR